LTYRKAGAESKL